MTALIEVLTAVMALTSLSMSRGKETTEIANATTAVALGMLGPVGVILLAVYF